MKTSLPGQGLNNCENKNRMKNYDSTPPKKSRQCHRLQGQRQIAGQTGLKTRLPPAGKWRPFLTTDAHGFNFSKPVRTGIFVDCTFQKSTKLCRSGIL
jgi:hypothetical protein